jgi:hypothetical protein
VKLDERVSTARTDLDEMFSDAPVPPAARVRTAHNRRRAAQLASGALAVAAVALGVTAVVADRDAGEPIILNPPTTPTTVIDASLSSRIELSTTVVESGGTINGDLVVENSRRGTIDVSSCGIDWHATSVDAETTATFVVDACDDGPIVTLQPGTNRMPIRFTARDQRGLILPPGAYEARLIRTTLGVPVPASISITVTEQVPQTTSTTAIAQPKFPRARTDLVQGGTTWAVILGGATIDPNVPVESYPAISAAVAAAEHAGYQAGPTDCDQGASMAMGADPKANGFTSVSVYFDSEADARSAADLIRAGGHETAVVAQLQTFCLD